jgi:hypothetical protein
MISTIAKQASYNAKRQSLSMQTRIVNSFMGQSTRLRAELWKRERCRSEHGLSLVLQCKLLKIVSNMVWDMHLLRTSILVTKTPLTTLKCLTREYVGRKHISNALINGVKERMTRAVKEIKDDMLQGLKQFVNSC